MKLMELRAALRKPGNPTMVVDLGNGVPMTIAFQKTPLLEELGKAFNDERTAETGLSYDPETNVLTVDGYVGAEPNDTTLAALEEAADIREVSASRYADNGEDQFDNGEDLMSPVADRDPADDEDDDLL